RVDSRVVLDEMGAERLLGCGDMLFLTSGSSKLLRAQGSFVSDGEVERVTEFVAEQGSPEFAPELLARSSAAMKTEAAGDAAPAGERDDMYYKAVDVVVREKRGSVSLLQRALGMGYGRAARMIDFMAEDGIVGDYNGSQAREVLYTTEQWDQIRRDRFSKAG
ncbi:MAG: DNA translocase FtsK, partial [Planctomycetia bacterium]